MAIVVLIARSKLVVDFALTIHLLHLVATTLYTRSLPRHSLWWMTMAGSAALSVGLGVWGCQHRELQSVFFGGGRILGAGAAAAPTNSQISAEEGQAGIAGDGDDDDDGGGGGGDDDAGYMRGRARGRGKDGAGEYEMVEMKQAP